MFVKKSALNAVMSNRTILVLQVLLFAGTTYSGEKVTLGQIAVVSAAITGVATIICKTQGHVFPSIAACPAGAVLGGFIVSNFANPDAFVAGTAAGACGALLGNIAGQKPVEAVAMAILWVFCDFRLVSPTEL